MKALDSVVSVAVGTMASEFEENESDVEPKKSTSALLAEVGAAVQVETQKRRLCCICNQKSEEKKKKTA